MGTRLRNAIRGLRRTALAAMACTLAGHAAAQFRIFHWDSFEDSAGKLSPALVHTNAGGADTTQVFDFASPQAPPGILDGMAATECGRYGLRFIPKSRDQLAICGLVHERHLAREKLGRDGCALVQADIFLPEKDAPRSNVALVAQHVNPNDPGVVRLYRFGLSSRSENTVYFSFADGGEAPVNYVQEEIAEARLARPGWHRFQMVFHGQDRIYCAVDGKFTAFSPIVEGTLKQLSPGLVVTTDAHNQGTVHCDNLSIQWTPVASPNLPESPWLRGTQEARDNPSLLEADSIMGWHSNTKTAWSESQRTGKPILILFYVPNLPAYRYLVATCPNDDGARALLSRYIPLRIDVNQLGGGRMAEKFEVTRVPLIMSMGTDGKPLGRVQVVNGKTTWEDIAAAIGG